MTVKSKATSVLSRLRVLANLYLISEGACPFECCAYREWSVLADTPLFEEPKDGSRVVGNALKGTKVQGLTGVVMVTEPGKIEVLRSHTGESGKTYEPGEIVWVYTELGEGFFKVWHNGEMYEEDAFFMYQDKGGWARCVDEGTCWGKRISFPNAVWWVQVKTSDGITGWSLSHQNFGDMDACG
jgi:hypothetical protein